MVGRRSLGAATASADATRSARAHDESDLRASADWFIYNHVVVEHHLAAPDLDGVFRALADGTRRDIVARLLGGRPASVSTLASRYAMSFAAVQKHVAVLEAAGLVTKRRRGRERIVHANPDRLARARELLTKLEDLWRARFGQLDAILAEPASPSIPTSPSGSSMSSSPPEEE